MGGLVASMKKIMGGRQGHIIQKWTYKFPHPVISSSVIADINDDGILEVITGTVGGSIIVLGQMGELLWEFQTTENSSDAVDELFLDQDIANSINASPIIATLSEKNKKVIIFTSERGIVYCLSHTGSLIWKFDTKSSIRGSVVATDINHDGKTEIVFGAMNSQIYILSEKGESIATFAADAPIESTPGFHEGQIVFGTNSGKIISISAMAKEIWSYQTKAKVTAAPAFGKLLQTQSSFVVIGSNDGTCYCFDTNGQLFWSYETKGAIYASVALADINRDDKQEILVGSCDNNVHAISCDGEKLWSYETDFWVTTTPIVTDIDDNGKPEIIIGSYDHNIYILDSEGVYLLDYVPGLSGVIQQAGHYTEIMTQEPGQHVGKKLWQFKTKGVVVGCTENGSQGGIIVNTKEGVIQQIMHEKG